MKNLHAEKPASELKGRLKASAEFIDAKDIKNKKILDIGCGYGWCELNLLKRGAKKIIGIEPAKNDLETAIKHIKNEKIEFKIASAIRLPFPVNLFDTVVCWEVIEHLPKNTEQQLFREVKRVLKKGGSFYLSTPYDNFFTNLFDPAYWLIGHRHYSKLKLTEYGLENSFMVRNLEVKGKFFSLLAILNMYIIKWLIKFNPFYQKYLTKLSDEEYNVRNGFVNIFIKYIKF